MNALYPYTMALTRERLKSSVDELHIFGRRCGLSDNQMNEFVERFVISTVKSSEDDDDQMESRTMSGRDSEGNSSHNQVLSVYRLMKIGFHLMLIMSFLTVCGYCIVSCHKPTQTLISRNIQDLIYPFMKFLRLSTLSLHKRIPSITAWHEEQCLISNPWYRNPDLNCWPCEDVRAVVDLTDFKSFAKTYYQNGIPFIIKFPELNEFNATLLETMYSENREALDKGTGYFASSIPSLKHARDVFEIGKSHKLYEYSKIHIAWQFKRVASAKILRAFFPRPYFVPNNTEVALQRYLFVDGPSSPSYSLPYTEFANVWLNQKLGRRILTLEPSAHCKNGCSSIPVVMYPGDILFYNWQFWVPQFHPSATSLSITFMGSFY